MIVELDRRMEIHMEPSLVAHSTLKCRGREHLLICIMSAAHPSPPSMNVIEKILCHHAVGLSEPYVQEGDVICVKADWTLASELTFQGMDTLYTSIGRPPLHRPDRFWLAVDHTVDPRVNHLPKQKALIQVATDFAAEHQLTDFWGPNTRSCTPNLLVNVLNLDKSLLEQTRTLAVAAEWEHLPLVLELATSSCPS